MTSKLRSLIGMGLVMFAAGWAARVDWLFLTLPAVYVGAKWLGIVAEKAEERDNLVKEIQKLCEEMQRRTS